MGRVPKSPWNCAYDAWMPRRPAETATHASARTAGVVPSVSTGTSLRDRAYDAATTNPMGADAASTSTSASWSADGMRLVSMKYAYDQSASNAKKYAPMGAKTIVAKSVTMTSERDPMPPADGDRASSSRAHQAKATPRAKPISGARGAGMRSAGHSTARAPKIKSRGPRNRGRHSR